MRTTIVVILVALVGAGTATSQSSQPSEYQLKAVFLFNFAKFIDWPQTSFASPEAPFAVCVFGKDPFGSVLDDVLLNKTIAARPVVLRRLRDKADARRCQMLFICSSEYEYLQGILDSLHGANTLIVGESDGFAASGGIIELTLEQNHVRFTINIDAAERADLRLSSKLLALAKIVHGTPNLGKE
jgi:YfiR/HmsC-like